MAFLATTTGKKQNLCLDQIYTVEPAKSPWLSLRLKGYKVNSIVVIKWIFCINQIQQHMNTKNHCRASKDFEPEDKFHDVN